MSNKKMQDPKAKAKFVTEVQKNGRLVWELLKHPRVSTLAKIVPFLGVLYWLNPIDPLPPPFNMTPIDDVAAFILGIKIFMELCPSDLVEELRYKINYGNSSDDSEVIDASYRVLDDDQ